MTAEVQVRESVREHQKENICIEKHRTGDGKQCERGQPGHKEEGW
ncbi:MAG: hypothetical protein NTY71_06695 [Methanoregula sp.]|nr:hypothetical protein [Methanoregula sp.]